eukprot:3261370-Rhodomonas_salina.1
MASERGPPSLPPYSFPVQLSHCLYHESPTSTIPWVLRDARTDLVKSATECAVPIEYMVLRQAAKRIPPTTVTASITAL